MKKADLAGKPLKSLKAMALRLGIKRFSMVRKEDLIKAILAAQPVSIPTSKSPLVKTAASGRSSTKTRPVSGKPTSAPSKRRTLARVPVASDALVQPVVAEHKYETPVHPAPVHTPSPYDDLGELPESYGTGRLFLSARDPHWIFTYWDYTWQQMEDIRRMARYSELKLRVLDGASPSAGVVEEITLNPSSRNWFFKVDRADAEYTAAFGYYDHSGNFIATARSGVTRTPPDGMSSNTVVRFVTIPYRIPFRKLFEMLKGQFRDGEELADVLYRLQLEGFPFPFDYPRPVRGDENVGRELEQYFDRELVRRIQVGSEILTEWMQRRFRDDVSSPSSPFGASFGPSSPARGFWFKVNAELIVYGATDPAARVRVDGREIALKPDGTFRFQFALPDGVYRLPASATSPDGAETREITLHFERKTRRKGEVGEVETPSGLETPPSSH